VKVMIVLLPINDFLITNLFVVNVDIVNCLNCYILVSYILSK